jgi:hypothetical protein
MCLLPVLLPQAAVQPGGSQIGLLAAAGQPCAVHSSTSTRQFTGRAIASQAWQLAVLNTTHSNQLHAAGVNRQAMLGSQMQVRQDNVVTSLQPSTYACYTTRTLLSR